MKPSAARAEPKQNGDVLHAPSCTPSPAPEALPHSDACFVGWVSSFLGYLWSSRCCLGVRPGDVWPVPLPTARWTAGASCNPSPRRRRRARLFRVAREFVRVQVGCLNWLALGCPRTAPTHACIRGAVLTSDQHSVLETLERRSLHFLRAGPFSKSTLGWSGEKFASLFSRASELSQADASCACGVDRLLSEFVSAFESDWCPYTRSRGHPEPPAAEPAQAASTPTAATVPGASEDLGYDSVGSNITCKPIQADRIKWTLPPSFNPVPFLVDPQVRSAYIDPETVKLPAAAWPRLPRAKVHATRAQLLKLAAKWDQFQALRIFRCSEVDPMETVGCFGVPKDENFDRFILNPSVANARSMKLSCYTKLLAPGCLLAQATLPTCDHFLRFCCDDLSEMYYTFVVPIRRAKRNCLGIVFQPSELQNFSVFNPRVHNEPCFLALNALAMGDCGAVEYAQQSHFNVLASLGNCMRPSEFCAYRRPFPRGQCAEFLSIDDHMTAQVCSRSQLQRKLPLRDTLIFSGADAAYPTVGLVPHEGKRRRNVTTGVFLGADVDGLTGIVSAPRHRTGVLMRVTAMVARAGVCSPALLSLLLGLWVHVLLFRRAGFAILQQVFTDARRTPATRIMSLHRDSVNELFCLCAVAPLLQADLRATYPGFLYAMDASPSGAGLCCAALPESVLRELWRHTEQKGFYTKLLEPASALLTDLGLSEDPGAFLVEGLSSASSSPFTPEPLPLRRPRDGLVYFLCLFGGDSNWTSAHCRAGLSDYAAFEPSLRPLTFADLGDKGTFRTLAALASSGRVHDWQACPPLSVAVSAPSLVRRLCFLLCLAASAGAFVSLALPSACTLLRMHCFRALVAWGGVVTELCFCAFGSPCRTPTVFFHNKPWVLKLGGCVSQCSCESAHFVEAGRFSAASARDFASRCHPCVESVFGRLPCVGELVPDFCQLCPLPLASRFASGSSLASTGVVVPAPCSASLRTLLHLGFLGFSPLPLDSEACQFVARSFHDDPEWIGELADCLEFGEVLRYKFGAPGHINVLEARAYKTWLKWCAKKHPNSRLVGLIDSRVLLGSAAKGRSASPALCHVLRSAVPYVLGCGLYPGGLHVYSAQNRSDGPSRGRPPAPPTKAWPAWLQALVRGDTRPFDLVCASAASVPRLLGRWLRLLLLLAGDVERNPGPFHDGGPRGAVDMEGGFAPSTRHKMDKAMRAFASWLMGTFSLPLGAVLGSAESASLALRAFGLHLYSSGQPRYLLVYALTAVQDSHPDFRSKLSSAWQVDRKWQLAEPGECRPVISQPIVQAAAALAICWGWFDWAALTLVGFLCMLHPAEMIWLTRQDLVFPEDALSPDPIMYVHIRNPKTQRFARRQHSRLEDPLVLSLLASLYLDLPLSSRLFRGSMHTYRRQWNKIMERLGVPHRLTDKGTTPGVLRGSGATFLYLETEDLPLVAWRGRWSKTKTVEFYLQEVAAQLLLQRLPQWARARVRLLSKYSRALLLSLIQDGGFRQGS